MAFSFSCSVLFIATCTCNNLPVNKLKDCFVRRQHHLLKQTVVRVSTDIMKQSIANLRAILAAVFISRLLLFFFYLLMAIVCYFSGPILR